MPYPFRVRSRRKLNADVHGVKHHRPMYTFDVEVWDISSNGLRRLVGVGTIEAPSAMWAAAAIHNGDVVVIKGSNLGDCTRDLRAMLRASPSFLAKNPRCSYGELEAEFFEEEVAYV